MPVSNVSRLSKRQLNCIFLNALGSAVSFVEDPEGNPLQLDVNIPYRVQLRTYIFNCTNPPGGRNLGEYKIQPMIRGHHTGDKCHFDFSDNRIPLVVGYAQILGGIDDGVFVLWDAYKHDEFSFSANFQVKAQVIVDALSAPVAQGMKNNGEIILAARSNHLIQAIEKRLDVIYSQI